MADMKKKVLSLEQFRASKASEANPEQARLVKEIETYQDMGSGKQVFRLRLVIGGKVIALCLLRFEDIDDCRGQWVPAMVRIKADSDSVKSTIEAIEEKGAELPPEQRTEKEESSE